MKFDCRRCVRVLARATFLLLLSSQAFTVGSKLDTPIPIHTSTPGESPTDIPLLFGIPCGVEELGADPIDKIKVSQLGISSATARELLDLSSRANPRYEWHFSDGMVHIGPRHLPRGLVNPLDRTVPSFKADNELSFRASVRLLRQAGIKFGTGWVGGNPRYSKVSVDLSAVSVREALNAIAKADGRVAWDFTISPSTGAGVGISNFFLESGHLKDGERLFR